MTTRAPDRLIAAVPRHTVTESIAHRMGARASRDGGGRRAGLGVMIRILIGGESVR